MTTTKETNRWKRQHGCVLYSAVVEHIFRARRHPPPERSGELRVASRMRPFTQRLQRVSLSSRSASLDDGMETKGLEYSSKEPSSDWNLQPPVWHRGAMATGTPPGPINVVACRGRVGARRRAAMGSVPRAWISSGGGRPAAGLAHRHRRRAHRGQFFSAAPPPLCSPRVRKDQKLFISL